MRSGAVGRRAAEAAFRRSTTTAAKSLAAAGNRRLKPSWWWLRHKNDDHRRSSSSWRGQQLRCLATFRDYRELQDLLPLSVLFDYNPYELQRHGKGESHHECRPPDVVVTPQSVQDVQTIVKYCFEHFIPIIPFGAGTSVEGHVSALHGGISLDMQAFQDIQIPNVHTSEEEIIIDPYAIVGPGVRRTQLNEALRHSGLQFVVDPGADATLGGMVATGASGTCTVKYGTMLDNLLELQVVMADGTIVNCGTKALKNSAGYNLMHLFCGSEGTLGIITSITVKLHPVPSHVVAATCQFDSLYEAAQAVALLKLLLCEVSRCELLDAASVVAFNKYNSSETPPPLPVKPTLFLEFQGSSETSLQEQVDMTKTICIDSYGGSSFNFCSDESERQALWAARHSLYYATVAGRPGSTGCIVTDCCVPLSQFAKLIDETARDVERLQIQGGVCFGHAGDGNLHCLLPVRDDDNDDYKQRLDQVQSNLLDRTLVAGGTCTGEHGVGYGKIPYLERQYGPGAVQVMRVLKQSLDPRNILNPGKVVVGDLSKQN